MNEAERGKNTTLDTKSMPEIEKGFRPQLHLILLGVVWLLCLGTFATYWLCLKMEIWRPSGLWWLLSTCTISITALLAFVLVFCRIFRRKHVTWSIGIFFLTITPLVLYGIFVWSIVELANDRKDVPINTSMKTMALWSCGFFEVKKQYDQIVGNIKVTKGEYVDLCEPNRTVNDDQLVQMMDQHMVAMANLLGKTPPDVRLVWYRDRLMGQAGRALGAWGICDVKNETDILTKLDRHEMAHTLITVLCSTSHEPPMLLAEGWAICQARDKVKLNSQLMDIKRAGNAQSLEGLMSDGLYGASIGPQYNHGGPFVNYLLERFGGPRFLELYNSVRRKSIAEDFKRVLNVSLKQIETDFWQWLAESELQATKENRAYLISNNANEATEDNWLHILDTARQWEREYPENLDSIAFTIKEAAQNQPSTTTTIVKRGHSIWFEVQNKESTANEESASNEGAIEYTLISPDHYAFVDKLPDGRAILNSSAKDLESMMRNGRPDVGQQVFDNRLSRFFDYNLLTLVPTGEMPIWVKDVSAGDDPQSLWTANVEMDAFDLERNRQVSLKLDPTRGFCVVESKTEGSVSATAKFESAEFDGRHFVGKKTLIDEDAEWITTVQMLTPSEANAAINTVEAAVKEAEAGRRFDLKSKLLRPWPMAIAWLTLIAMVFAVDWLGNLKFAPKQSQANRKASS